MNTESCIKNIEILIMHKNGLSTKASKNIKNELLLIKVVCIYKK